jgi:hypothetical protein
MERNSMREETLFLASRRRKGLADAASFLFDMHRSVVIQVHVH